MQTVLNVIGIDDQNNVKIVNNTGNIRNFTFEMNGNSNLTTNISSENIEMITIVFGGLNQDIQLKIAPNVILFNSICGADSSAKALKLLSDFVIQTKLPIINHPDDVVETTRDGVSKKLSSVDGLVVPKCIKVLPNSIKEVKEIIKKEHFPFPFIFRTTCDHGSENMIKIDSLDDLVLLDFFALNGKNEFYMIEFIDYKSTDGYYRKLRYWVVGNKVIPRHLVVSSSWNVSYEIKKEMMYENKELQSEEKFFLNNIDENIEKKCLAIKKALNLDYFGIDCNIDEKGNMLIFEATPCMALTNDSNFEYLNKTVVTTKEAVEELIEQYTKVKD